MKPIDLHIHTNYSDGMLSPKEIVDLAIRKRIKTIAITDHDSVSGIREALTYSRGKNIEVIPGVEISCHGDQFNVLHLHILGLFIDYRNRELRMFLGKIEQKGLKKFLRKVVSFLKLYKIREILPLAKRISLQKKASIKEAVNIIKEAGGVSILAHPGLIKYRDLIDLVDYFKKCGGGGLEADYPYDRLYSLDAQKSEELNELVRKIAKENGLILSGGSDFHGNERNVAVGERGINEEEFSMLSEKCKDFKVR